MTNAIPAAARPAAAEPLAGAVVLQHGVRVGLGAVGLARRAGSTILLHAARRGSVPGSPTPPGAAAASVPGALVGLALVVERGVLELVGVVAGGLRNAADVVPAPVGDGLRRVLSRPLGDLLWSLNEVARREQRRNRAEAAALLPVLVQQVAEAVVAQLDFRRLVAEIPVDELLEYVDIDALVARIDVASIIRESTASMTTEAVDALRAQGMALDAFVARVEIGRASCRERV